MNEKIKALNEKLATLHGSEEEIETQLQAEWNKVFDDSTQLKEALAKLEQSNDYHWDRFGEIASYIRFYPKDFENCKRYLIAYMREYHYVEIDFDCDILTRSVGPAIVINDDDGGVYDQDGDKFFIKKSDYRDEDGKLDLVKRNELIEEYMEKTGCFPGVYSSDHYGNISSVKTTKD